MNIVVIGFIVLVIFAIAFMVVEMFPRRKDYWHIEQETEIPEFKNREWMK